jgi:hypothetical protein
MKTLSEKLKFILQIVLVSLFIMGCSMDNDVYNRSENESNVRISWDYNTFQEMTEVFVENKDFVENSLYYPRIKKLSNGSLFMSFSNHHYGWNIYVRRSDDNGKSWSAANMVREAYKTFSTVGDDEKVFVNADFIQLNDGRILLAYQWRYKAGYWDIPNTNINCGIEIMFSDDLGQTFSDPVEIYRGRCWEPAMLQLPSGEIHMYITSSQDVVDGISSPRTVVIRSFDGGLTWQGKQLSTHLDNEAISRTVDDRTTYDGMPSAVWLDDNNGIAVPLEVWHSRFVVDQTPIIVKTGADVNWRIDQDKIVNQGGPDYPNKKQINKDLWGYGPYSTKLGTGEVVVLCNGTYKGVQGIWTLIGDKKADNFRYATSPFEGYWGCIDYIGNNEVLAAGTVEYNDNGVPRAKVVLMKGRLNYAKNITKGDIEMVPVRQFDRNNNDYWFLGKMTSSSVFTNFGYTDENFQFATYLFDRNLAAFTPKNSDASVMLLNRTDKNGISQNFKFVVNAAGKYTIYQEENYSWVLIDKGITKHIDVDGTINDDDGDDVGFAAKVEVDWELLGGKPTSKDEFRVHLRQQHKDKSTEKPLSVLEGMAGENSDYPQEWLRITLTN